MAIKQFVIGGPDGHVNYWICDTTAEIPATASEADRVYCKDTKETFVHNGSAFSRLGMPVGVILMWAGLLVNIPSGWLLCDGTNGTPDLRSSFIKGAAAGIDPGVTGGAASHIPTGTVSQPTFAGSALAGHAHGVGTLAASAHAGTAVNAHSGAAVDAHSGAAVADHAAHTHSVTSNVAVADHAAHTHPFTQSSNAATPDLLTINTASTGVAASGTTGNPSATLSHTVTNNAVTSGTPSATLAHAVTQPANHVVTQPANHTVTQPSDHTLSGSSASVSAGTPAGTVSQPTFTGASQNTEPVFYSLAYIQKAA